MSYTRGLDNGSTNARVVPRFFTDTVENAVASQREGRPIFTERELVEISVPGDPYSKPVQRVTDEHRNRWPEHYKAFRAGVEPATDGIPLEQWPVMRTKAMVLEMKAIGLTTVEQCAAMSDTACQRIRTGGYRLRDLAKSYLDDALAQAELVRRTAEADAAKAEVTSLKETVANLSALVDQLHRQMSTQRDAPHELATSVAAHHFPAEAAKYANPRTEDDGALSALGDLPAARKRGRPTNAEIAARAMAEGGDGTSSAS